MRVTFLHPTHAFLPGGGTRIVHEYANYLTRHGHEVNLVFPYSIESEPGVDWHRAKHVREWWQARTSASIRKTMGKSALRWMALDPRIKLYFVSGLDSRFVPDADVVFATYWRTAEYVPEYPVSKGKKFYLIQHYETWAGPKDRVDRTWLTPLHKVVVSRWLYEIGSSLQATRMRYITNAIDHQQFRIIPSTNPRRLALLSMYSGQPWKGGSDAVAVFGKIHERFPDLHMSMFGINARSAEIPSWVEYFHDPKPDEMRDLYNRHSIYLGASWEEGWGLPPAEAMACGCTFAGTDIGGFREFAINGRTALLSAPRDREAMVQNVCRLIENSDLRSRLQKAGTEYIKQFTWEKSGALLESYLSDVVEADHREVASVASHVPANDI